MKWNIIKGVVKCGGREVSVVVVCSIWVVVFFSILYEVHRNLSDGPTRHHESSDRPTGHGNLLDFSRKIRVKKKLNSDLRNSTRGKI